MPHYNVWIRRDHEERFSAEANKSGLINDLLDAHYSKAPKVTPAASPTEIFNGLTCKAGHPSKDGKHCSNIKCSYYL